MLKVFGDRPHIRHIRGRDFKEKSTLNLDYGENGKTFGNETKTQTIATLQILLTSLY